MAFTRTTFIRSLKIASISIAIAAIVIYAIWRSLNYARGPHIDISSPQDGSSISLQTVTIVGRVERANVLTLNGSPISVDESGNFRETILVFPGTNKVNIQARDSFGREVASELLIFGKAQWQNPPLPETSSTTGAGH